MSRLKGASSDSVQLQFLLGSSIRRKNRAANQQLKQQQQQQQQQLLSPTVRVFSPHRSWSNIDIDVDEFYCLSSQSKSHLQPPKEKKI